MWCGSDKHDDVGTSDGARRMLVALRALHLRCKDKSLDLEKAGVSEVSVGISTLRAQDWGTVCMELEDDRNCSGLLLDDDPVVDAISFDGALAWNMLRARGQQGIMRDCGRSGLPLVFGRLGDRLAKRHSTQVAVMGI
jgi:hypothetical protein